MHIIDDYIYGMSQGHLTVKIVFNSFPGNVRDAKIFMVPEIMNI